MNSTPIMVPLTLPRPPDKRVPPIITAAITSNSVPTPMLEVAEPITGGEQNSSHRREEACAAEDQNTDPVDWKARQTRGVGVAADSVYLAPKHRLFGEKPGDDIDDNEDHRGRRNPKQGILRARRHRMGPNGDRRGVGDILGEAAEREE